MLPRGVSWSRGGPGWSQDGTEMGPRRCRGRRSKIDAKDAPFAKSSDSLPLMRMRMHQTSCSEISRAKLFRKRRVRSYRGRGECTLVARTLFSSRCASGNEELSWAALAEALFREGVKRTQRESKLTRRAVAQVWRRVCRDVEAEADAAAAAAPKRKYPSRISPDWRPQVVPPSQPSAAQAASNAPYDPDEQLARIRRIIAERSGRKA